MELSLFFFSIFAVLAVATAITTITSKNPVVSAFSLVVHFFMLAGIYLTLNAQFVAVMQVLVYAGAIMVLVIFVIMLLNIGFEESHPDKFNFRKGIAMLLGAVFIFQFMSIYFSQKQLTNGIPSLAIKNGTVEAVGKELFTNYLFPFEFITLLLVVAIIGAIILAKKKLKVD